MHIEEQIKELEKKVAKEPVPPVEDDNGHIVTQDDPVDEPQVDDAPVEPDAVPAPVEPEPDSAMARARYDAAEAKRKAEDLQKQLDDLRREKNGQPKQEAAPKHREEAPDYNTDPIGNIEYKINSLSENLERIMSIEDRRTKESEEQRIERLEWQAIDNAEAQFKSVAPDYDDVAGHMVNTMMESVKRLYPGTSDPDAVKYVRNNLRTLARNAAARGEQPAEYLYNLGKQTYKPAAPETPALIKPDLAKLDANRRKAKNGTSGAPSKPAGNSKGIGLKEASTMSVAELQRNGIASLDDLR